MKIAIAQINSTIGDFTGNRTKILEVTHDAREAGAEIVVFPEMSLCGYPPMDLVDQETFIDENLRSLRRLQQELPPAIAAVVGYVGRNHETGGKSLKNVASIIRDGTIQFHQEKRLLPTYDVFDEARYFEPGRTSRTWTNGDHQIGIAICEDIWWESEPDPDRRYPVDPVRDLLDAGATIIVVPSASPYYVGKRKIRRKLLSSIGRTGNVPVVYVNAVGGNDSLIFDGASMITDSTGTDIRECPPFQELLQLFDISTDGTTVNTDTTIPLDLVPNQQPGNPLSTSESATADTAPTSVTADGSPAPTAPKSATVDGSPAPTAPKSATVDGSPAPTAPRHLSVDRSPAHIPAGESENTPTKDDPRYTLGETPWPLSADDLSELESALTLGIRDYLVKTGFSAVHLGLSGGIDSALVAVLAVRALGSDRVRGFLLPSAHSSAGSITDSEKLARNLGIRFDKLPIQPACNAITETLTEQFSGTEPGLAEENIQARVRGLLLMAWSNKKGSLLLTTGNKSELAVGYCTLYGDMAGALAVIGDVFKTEAYALSRYINRDEELIPGAIITKPPSAELRPDQTDQDSLPPYPELDRILASYLISNRTFSQIVTAGYDPETVEQVLSLVGRSEYKRRQAPPVLKVSPRAFGTGRRMPIARRIYEAHH